MVYFFFDRLSVFNENLKEIKRYEVLIFFSVIYLFLFGLGKFEFPINEKWIYLFVIFYFVYKLRDSLFSVKEDLSECFSKNYFKNIVLIVVLNIFFSYGMLYLTNASFQQFDFLRNSLPVAGGFISTVVISAVCEELIFRGVFISRLKLMVPTTFAIIISSLLFGALHSFGSMFSAFVFAICMAILYVKSDNICVPIFAHFLNNLVAEIIVRADVNEVLFTNASVMSGVSILALISAIILFIGIYRELNSIK